MSAQPIAISWSRVAAWCVVGLGAIALGIALGRSAEWADTAVGLAILTAFVGFLTVEAALLVGFPHAGGRVASPITARPADGVIEVVAMADVLSTIPAETMPWKQFETLPGPIGPTHPARVRSRSVMSNPPLLGQVALVSVFVGCDGRRWTGREIRAAHESLRAAGRWLEREAIAWAAPVNVGLADTYFVVEDDRAVPVAIDFVAQGDDFGPMEADATTKAMASASRAAAALGFGDVADLVERINSRLAADAHVWLLHRKQRGRSHAIPVGDRVVQGVGMAICYAREASFPEPLAGPGRVDPTTVAHELLHLFGATDKYGVPLAGFPPGSVSRRDVMRLDEERLDRLKVGKLTAAEVGWPVARPHGPRNARSK